MLSAEINVGNYLYELNSPQRPHKQNGIKEIDLLELILFVLLLFLFSYWHANEFIKTRISQVAHHKSKSSLFKSSMVKNRQ